MCKLSAVLNGIHGTADLWQNKGLFKFYGMSTMCSVGDYQRAREYSFLTNKGQEVLTVL
jgi:hypothetical protein